MKHFFAHFLAAAVPLLVQAAPGAVSPNLTPIPRADACENPPLKHNFLGNPHFKVSSNGSIEPWSSDHPYSIVPNPVGKGNAIQYSIPKRPYLEYTLSQRVGVCPIPRYVLSFDYKIDQRKTNPRVEEHAAAIYVLLGDCEIYNVFQSHDSRFGNWHNLQVSAKGAEIMKGNSNYNDDAKEVIFHLTSSDTFAYNATLANFKLTRLLPGDIKTKGPNLIQNGGFESGELAPWSYTSDSLGYYDYPNGTAPCSPNAPLAAVVTPGLPALKAGGTMASKFKFNYCGQAVQYDTYKYDSQAYLTIQQNVPTDTVLDTPYVLTVEYRTGNAVLGVVSLGDFYFNYFGEDEDNLLFDDTIGSNVTKIFQRVLGGQGHPATLTMNFLAYKPKKPEVKFMVEIDNVSLRKLDAS